jgi:hypothetical protein
VTYRGNGPVVPHLETTVASSSGGGASPAFIVGLLGVDVKRGSNRRNDKKLHCSCSGCSCNGGGTSLAFVVSLLDVGNKRGGNRLLEPK